MTTMMRRLVVIESPYAGRVPAWVPWPFRGLVERWRRRSNVRYARRCMRDSLDRSEAPYASHLFYTQVLDDNVMAERALGITCGFAWAQHAELRAVYCDRGVSGGMTIGITQRPIHQSVEYRYIDTHPTEIPVCIDCGVTCAPDRERCGRLQCRPR